MLIVVLCVSDANLTIIAKNTYIVLIMFYEGDAHKIK